VCITAVRLDIAQCFGDSPAITFEHFGERVDRKRFGHFGDLLACWWWNI
jgi:hypothetical protein